MTLQSAQLGQNHGDTGYPLSALTGYTPIGSYDFLNALVLGSLPRGSFVTCHKPRIEITYSSPVVVEPKALPLDWLLGRALPSRVMARLMQAEAHEVNPHLQSDYRQAWITLSFALKGVPDAFVQASYVMYGIHPDKVWPSIVADRKQRLAKEYYDFYDSADNLRPDIPRIPPSTANADTHAAHGAGSPTGTGAGSVPNPERRTQ